MGGINKGLVWAVAAIIVLAGGWWFYSNGNSTPAETGPIKIGFIGPLTGDAAAYGEPVKDGIELAVEEINKSGGVNGRQISMIYEDGKCDGQAGASATQKLVNIDGVKYIIGGTCSAETFAAIPIASAAQVFVISPSASAPKLAGISPLFVRNNPNDNVPGVALADYWGKLYKKVAVISEKTDYAQGLKGVFITQAQKNGLQIVSTQDYDSNTTDFRTILLAVKNANPDAVFINPQTPANMVRIAQQGRTLGLKAAFASAAFNDAKTVGAGSFMEGMVLAVPPGLALSGKGAAFTANYKAKYGTESPFPFYSGSSYDDVYLLAQAISSVGDNPTKVARYLYSLPSYTGTLGTYHFDQNGDLAGITSILQKILNGKAVNL